MAAIAATAVSAGESFLPYMAATCGMLGPLMTLTEDNVLNVSVEAGRGVGEQRVTKPLTKFRGNVSGSPCAAFLSMPLQERRCCQIFSLVFVHTCSLVRTRNLGCISAISSSRHVPPLPISSVLRCLFGAQRSPPPHALTHAGHACQLQEENPRCFRPPCKYRSSNDNVIARVDFFVFL